MKVLGADIRGSPTTFIQPSWPRTLPTRRSSPTGAGAYKGPGPTAAPCFAAITCLYATNQYDEAEPLYEEASGFTKALGA